MSKGARIAELEKQQELTGIAVEYHRDMLRIAGKRINTQKEQIDKLVKHIETLTLRVNKLEAQRLTEKVQEAVDSCVAGFSDLGSVMIEVGFVEVAE